jgi:enoyl-CoA hydratase/carnithine racemase
MTNEASVLYSVSQGVARVTMNRPAAMNAMSRGLIIELRETLERAQHDPEAALIVLGGAGANF